MTQLLDTKTSRIQSLEGQVSTAISELDAARIDMQELIEEKKQWVAHYSDLLEATGHMNPREMEELNSLYENTKKALPSSKSELEALTSEHVLSKTELNSSKTALEAVQKELESVRSNMKELEISKEELESEHREFIKSNNDRERVEADFMKRCNEAEKKLEEKDKLLTEKEKKISEEKIKITELEKKLSEEKKEITELEKKLVEKEKVVEPKPASHTSGNKETSSEDARSEAVSKSEVSEKQLARAQQELTLLKKRYKAVLALMHASQSKKKKCEKELEELKAAQSSEIKGSAKDAKMIKKLQSQVDELTKFVSDGQLENNRLEAMASIATNRSKKLIEEIGSMKSQLEEVLVKKTRTAAAKVPPPTTAIPTPVSPTEEAKLGDKRAREEGELEDGDIPTRNVQPHLT
ncbi:hypothetical protein K501DRAFT_279236 [Backusella circina FSU 941]|nr:hypothetical protein K501DRAFT_279236 [Backusella circina FSU 941]